MRVADVDLVGTGAPSRLDVIAVAPTLGWSRVGLSPVIYIVPPQDGVQEVVLTGTPPAGPAAEQLQVFNLSMSLTPPAWLQGVRVTPATRSGGAPGLTVHRTRLKAPPIGQDMLLLGKLGVRGDKLVADVSYSGGCAKHTLQLSWDGVVHKSLPPRIVLDLSHDAHGDVCRKLVEETLQFDLSVLPGLPAEVQTLVVSVNGVAVEAVSYTPPSLKGAGFTKPRSYLDLPNWHAFHDMIPGGPPNLYVTGDVVVPSKGYVVGLTPAVSQGINPHILLLDLSVTRPSGKAATVVDTVQARWDVPGPYDGRYGEVHVRCEGEVVLELPIQVIS